MVARSILVFALCSAVPAHASPRTDPTAGRAVFTGATTWDASSIALNPAALGQRTTNEVFLAVSSVLDQWGIDRKELDPATGTLSPGAQVDDAALGLGGMFAVVFHPGDRYAVSFLLHSPPPETVPTGHDPLRYHSLGASQRDVIATIGSTIRITSGLYFGASLSHDNTFLRLRYARDAALANGNGPRGIGSDCGGAPCGIENPAATELYDVDVSSPIVSTSNLAANIGLLARVYRDIWIGLAYHTPPGFDIQTALAGDMNITRAPRDGGIAVKGGSTVYVSYPASVDLEVRARLPQLLELHVGGRWEDLSRMQAYDVRGYGSTLPRNEIPEWQVRPRGLHDSFALWAGVEQLEYGQPVRFGARIGVETSALDASRTSALTISPASATVDLGLQYRIARSSWVLQLSYGLQYFPTVSVDDSAYDPRYQLDCIDSGFDYSTRACAAVRSGYAIPTAAGDYSRIQHAARLGLRYEWLP